MSALALLLPAGSKLADAQRAAWKLLQFKLQYSVSHDTVEHNLIVTVVIKQTDCVTPQTFTFCKFSTKKMAGKLPHRTSQVPYEYYPAVKSSSTSHSFKNGLK